MKRFPAPTDDHIIEKPLIERVLPIIDRSLSSDEKALSRLVPVSTDGDQPSTSEANAGGVE